MSSFGFIYAEKKAETKFYSKSLIRILLLLKGSITKFVLYIPTEIVLDAEDVKYWIHFLSTKGIKELVIINMRAPQLKLPTYLFSCLELKHLTLHNCNFHLGPTFRGFPNLLSFDFRLTYLVGYTYGEFITLCPLLESLNIQDHITIGNVKPTEITIHENLKSLYLSLCKLENVAVTSSSILELMGFLPKLEELELDFYMCKFLAEDGANSGIPAALQCIKTLTLHSVDFNNRSMLLCMLDLIHASPKLQTLGITATADDRVSPPPLSSREIDRGIKGNLQLQNVKLKRIRDSRIDLCFIKSLLAYASLLKQMDIFHTKYNVRCFYNFAKKLLKLRRASPMAEILIDDAPDFILHD